jgi:hypothetical protein
LFGYDRDIINQGGDKAPRVLTNPEVTSARTRDATPVIFSLIEATPWSGSAETTPCRPPEPASFALHRIHRLTCMHALACTCLYALAMATGSWGNWVVGSGWVLVLGSAWVLLGFCLGSAWVLLQGGAGPGQPKNATNVQGIGYITVTTGGLQGSVSTTTVALRGAVLQYQRALQGETSVSGVCRG